MANNGMQRTALRAAADAERYIARTQRSPVDMADNIPQWADAELSDELPELRAAGESSTVEFKERFPDQAHRLAEELAALGTSGGGLLLIGINDNGDLVGVNALDGDARDDVVERAQGIVSSIRPTLNADIVFAVENGTPVLAIRVPAQDEPVFYYNYRPYVRDGRRSRRANPDEVKERVWAHPSAEYKREVERIKLEQHQTIVDSGRRFMETMSESRRRRLDGP